MNRMRNAWMKKVGYFVLICMLSFSGCSLAVEDAGEENVMSQDRLIGAFITTEYLDLFNMEAYLNDHADELINDDTDEIIVDGRAYSERLYAVIDKKDSVKPMDWEISFGDVEGICFFDAKFQNEGEEPFTMIIGGDEICDVTSSLSVGDEGESVALKGTLYALIGEYESVQFYVNPVYQTTDGEIYTITGNGYSMSGELGGSSMVNLEEETTITENEVTKTYAGAVEITFEVLKYLPVNICIQFMNDKLEIMQTENYAAGEVPAQLSVLEGTACIIVETQWEDGSVTRALYEPEEDESVSIETFYKTSDIALGTKETEIVWK